MVERKTLAFVASSYKCCSLRLTTVAAASALVSREMALGKGSMDDGERPLKPALQ